MSIKEIANEINYYFVLYGKNAVDVDYDSIGVCPFCNSRIDEFYFCACGGNMGLTKYFQIQVGTVNTDFLFKMSNFIK